MTDLVVIFVALGALAAVLAHIAIWSPRRIWVKLTALTTTAMFLPVGYLAVSELLGRPKPIGIEWVRADIAEATVLSSKMAEGEAIYVWLGIEGLKEPLAYVLPWDERTARQLHGAERSAQERGTQVQMREPFERSLDQREPVFYAPPQSTPPPKEAPAQNAFAFPGFAGTAEGLLY